MNRLSFKLLSIFLVFLFVVTSSTDADELAPSGAQEFFRSHCLDCHDATTKEGGLDLSALGKNLLDPQTMASWVRIHDRVDAGEMPPKAAEPVPATVRQAFVKATSDALDSAHRLKKGTVLRRLNGREYENTINDLFGTNLRLAAMLPPDGRSHEFDNVGNALSMSMVQLRQYLNVMDTVLDASIASTVTPPEPTFIKTGYAETSEGDRFIGDKWLKAKDGAVVFFQDFSYPTGMLRSAGTRSPGLYRIRVKGYAYQSNEPVTFSVGATTFVRGVERPTFGYFSMPPGKPTTIELTAWIENRYMLDIRPFGIYDEKYEIKSKGIENYTGPGLAIQSVEFEGPLINEFPSRGHKLLFTGLDRKELEPRNPNDKKKSWYKPKFDVSSSRPGEDAHAVLRRIAEHAFRRPVTADQVEPYVALFLAEMESGESFEQALRTATTAIFCAPDFLYFNETSGELDDFALANRLSYFLSRSSPDEELRLCASQKQLASPTVLQEQTDRLLQGRHSERFIDDFTDAWLNLRDIEFTTPDRNLFPEYDAFLLDSMIKETRAYFAEQIKNNLPIETIVKSDFAMLNNRLADHYQIDGVHGPEIRKVKLPPGHVRGGFLSQASIHKVSANGTNTSPIVRGVWVLERIMGKHAPPPPPGISGVEPDIRGASTLREILAKHRNSESCRTCHEMIDPPGFALESFNPIGGWRDNFRSIGNGEKVNLIVHGRKTQYRVGLEVDASGEFSDGRKFVGFQEFRDHLVQDEYILTESFVKKLLIFATGRELGFSDRNEIAIIVETAIKEQHGIRDLIHDVIQSEIFRNK